MAGAVALDHGRFAFGAAEVPTFDVVKSGEFVAEADGGGRFHFCFWLARDSFPADKKTFAHLLIFCKHYFNLFLLSFSRAKEAEQWGGYDGEERHS
jgi:hypothetical protein